MSTLRFLAVPVIQMPMKITAARVIVTCPGRNFVTLKIICDDGTTGCRRRDA